MGMPDHLSPKKCVCRTKTAVRTRHGTTDWFKTGTGVRQGCILSPCLFNLYAEGCACMLICFSHVWLFATLWTVAHQALLSWDSPGKNTGVGCHFLLQGIFPTQGLNPGLLHCRQTLYHLSHQGSLVNIMPDVVTCITLGEVCLRNNFAFFTLSFQSLLFI